VKSESDAVLLDTDVFSYLLNEADKRAEIYKKHVQNKTLAISFVTVGELHYGALKKKWGSRRLAVLNARMKAVVVIPYDIEVCREYARIKIEAKTLAGTDRTIGANDLWIAACARHHDLPLISNNRKHFEGLPGIILISEAPILKQIDSQQKLPLIDSSEPPSSQ
jgi:tRNA(fMet)-specific endonuclease VapC